MNLQLESLAPTLRIVPGEPLSVPEFWRLSAQNPDLRMEREPVVQGEAPVAGFQLHLQSIWGNP